MFDIFSEAEVDAGSPTLIKNVLLCGNISKNGYEIPPAAFVDDGHTKKLYEGVQVFLDHKNAKSIKDLVGVIRNARFTNGKPYGDIDIGGFPEGPTLAALARTGAKGIGMSHVAYYQMDKATKKVNRVEAVRSVDVVINPATTSTFFEHTRNPMDPTALELLQESKQTLETQLKESQTCVVEANAKVKTLESENTSLKTQVETLTKESKELKTKLDEHETRQALEARKADALSELKEHFKDEIAAGKASLEDQKLFSTTFLEHLFTLATKEARAALITDRKAVLEGVLKGNTGATSRERTKPAGDKKAFDVESFLNDSSLLT